MSILPSERISIDCLAPPASPPALPCLRAPECTSASTLPAGEVCLTLRHGQSPEADLLDCDGDRIPDSYCANSSHLAYYSSRVCAFIPPISKQSLVAPKCKLAMPVCSPPSPQQPPAPPPVPHPPPSLPPYPPSWDEFLNRRASNGQVALIAIVSSLTACGLCVALYRMRLSTSRELFRLRKELTSARKVVRVRWTPVASTARPMAETSQEIVEEVRSIDEDLPQQSVPQQSETQEPVHEIALVADQKV